MVNVPKVHYGQEINVADVYDDDDDEDDDIKMNDETNKKKNDDDDDSQDQVCIFVICLCFFLFLYDDTVKRLRNNICGLFKLVHVTPLSLGDLF